MDVLNYNIGNSSTAIARDKHQVSTMSIGGVANITAIRGYRDLNLVCNMPRYGYSSSKKEFGNIVSKQQYGKCLREEIYTQDEIEGAKSAIGKI